MSPALRDYALLWSTATATRDPRGKWVFGLIALALMLIVGLLVWVETRAPIEVLKYVVRVPVAVYLFAELTYYVPGAVRLNTPASARLVPRMRRRLVQLTLLVWTVSTAAAVLMAWDTPAPGATVAVATLAWLVGLGLSATGYQVGAYVQALVFFSIVSKQYVPDILFEPMVAAGIGLLLLALAARTLELMFPNGGDRHWERRRAQVQATERTTTEGMLRQASRVRFGGWLYAATLRRNSTTRRAPALLLCVLDPAMHWARYLHLLAMVLLATGAAALFRVFTSGAPFVTGWVIGMCQVMLFAQLFAYLQRGQRLADTATEQSLLRMAPSIPAQARPFNRHLNASLLRVALLDWAAILAASLTVSAFAGAPREALLLQVQICCLLLPMVAANVRDHARSSGLGLLRLIGGLAAALAVSVGIGAVSQMVADTPVMPVAAAASIVLAVVVVVWRWRAAVAAPYAFPVGRLA